MIRGGSQGTGFDLVDPAIQADPFAHYEWLREQAPVYAAPWRKGATVYVLSRYEDVVAALKDPETYSSQVAPAPIRHTLQRAFTPRAIEALVPRVDELAAGLCDAFLADGGGDFIEAFAHPLPALVIGVVRGDEVCDVTTGTSLPADMCALLAAGSDALKAVRREAEHATRIPLTAVHLEAPVPNPPKFLGIGLNYADHVAESGMQEPEFPIFFTKQRTCVTGPYDPIHRPCVSKALDYEGELAFVIGRRCRHVPKERAHEVIAGYLVADDVSVRDWQFKAPTMTLGKSFDTHGPLGPWLTTSDEIEDPHGLDLKTFVNGEQRQHSNTRHLIFDCFEQVAVLSTVFTLEPGDVITTGTPNGVGAAMKPMSFLVPGDVVRVEVEGLGHIENRVIDEPEATAGPLPRAAGEG